MGQSAPPDRKLEGKVDIPDSSAIQRDLKKQEKQGSEASLHQRSPGAPWLPLQRTLPSS